MRKLTFLPIYVVGNYVDKLTDVSITAIPIRLIYKVSGAKLCGFYFSRKQIPANYANLIPTPIFGELTEEGKGVLISFNCSK
jgi:hypothetical protein